MIPTLEQVNTFGKLCSILILLYISLSKTLLESKPTFGKHSRSLPFQNFWKDFWKDIYTIDSTTYATFQKSGRFCMLRSI